MKGNCKMDDIKFTPNVPKKSDFIVVLKWVGVTKSKLFRVSPVMTTSISLHKYDATACIIFMQSRLRCRSMSASSSNPLRIPLPKI